MHYKKRIVSGMHVNEDRAMIEKHVNGGGGGVDDEDFLSLLNGMDDSQLSDDRPDLSPKMTSALAKLACRLCSACQNICRGETKVEIFEENCKWEQTGEMQYHPSLSSLRESADAGCPFCKEISHSFEERLSTHFDVRDSVTDSWYITCSLRGPLEIPLFPQPSWRKELHFRFSLYDSNSQCVNNMIGGAIIKMLYPAKRLIPGPEYLEYVHEATEKIWVPDIALARLWVDKCLNRCYHRGDEARSKTLPSRLIEVRIGGDTSPGLVARLCQAEDLSADASYLTLSHCWGGNAICTLTKGNFEALQHNISIQQLPILFQDALYMTCQLGFKYIWIDCLCILQDCQDDWEYEAARMGDVYQNAAFNIAASGYQDGKVSLFQERTPIPLLNYPLVIDRMLVANNETTTYPAQMSLKDTYVRADILEFSNAVTKGPLNSRGWVAQERALSPGILHFTPKQMWWECNDHIFSESFPYVDFNRDLERSLNPLHVELDNTGKERDVYFLWKWNKFMAFYAGTDLTIWSDRFPALTGIARKFATITANNLIAGFWESDLISSLAWRVSAEDHAKKIPPEQLAPTWSWAFLCVPHKPGYVFQSTTAFSFCRRVLSDDPGFRSDLQYKSRRRSAVRGLELTGPLRILPVEADRLGGLPEWVDYDLEVLVYYDVADQSYFSAADIADEAWHWLWEEPTHMPPLIQEGTPPKFYLTCLLLSLVTGLEHQNTFRRVGVVQIHFKDQDTCSRALGLDDGNEGPKPRTVFEDCGTHDLILI